MNLSKLLKTFCPVSKEKKAEYLEKVSSLVDFYKPKIKKKTGIRLPKVTVEEYADSSLAHFHSKPKNILKKLIHQNAYSMFCSGSTIYVPWGLGAKQNILEFDSPPCKSVDQIVVHELSHVLWNTITLKSNSWHFPPCSKKKVKEFKKISEGFACYCAQEWFADFYPENIKIVKQKNYFWRPSCMTEPYTQGKKKIEKLVKEFGEDILLKIPENFASL